VNFMMDEGQDRIKAAYRDNYARLAQTSADTTPTTSSTSTRTSGQATDAMPATQPRQVPVIINSPDPQLTLGLNFPCRRDPAPLSVVRGKGRLV
jgi:hypothetical protein